MKPFLVFQKFKLIITILLGVLIILPISCQKSNTLQKKGPNHTISYVITPKSILDTVPTAPNPTAGGNLPNSFLLEVPDIRFNQGYQGSCASCAIATDKSIVDHVKYQTQYPDGEILYSPAFLFNQVHLDPDNCLVGSYITTNLDILKSQGICLLSKEPYNSSDCQTLPNSSQIAEASLHKIDHYFKIDPIDAGLIKQFIKSGLPVIIGFKVDEYFDSNTPRTDDDVWDKFGNVYYGNHCTLLYGWDDSKHAFKMLNSWGNDWANDGTIWVDYDFVSRGTSIYGKVFTEAYIIQEPAVTNTLTADFSVVDNTTISVGQSINFKDKSLGNPNVWSWSFPGGNPSSSTEQNPTVSYSLPGSYAVTLKVANQNGSNTKKIADYIKVESTNQIPVADFTISGSTSISEGANVNFFDASTNTPSTWSWSFPGGTPSSSIQKNPVISYQIPGTYDVSLNVSNQSGTSSTLKIGFITVNSSSNWVCGQPFIDPRDGQAYKTISIGGNCWMAENLKYSNNGNVGINYDNNSSNLGIYGRLYSFNELLYSDVAPPGWHVASMSEVDAMSKELFSIYGREEGGAMKSISNLWSYPNLGATNASGFNALPGGRYIDGVFSDLESNAYFWTSTPNGTNGGSFFLLNYNNASLGAGGAIARYYNSVRCVKN